MRTKNEVTTTVVLDYLTHLPGHSTPTSIESELLDALHDAFETENAIREKGNKWKYYHTLPNIAIAEILKPVHGIKRMSADRKLTSSSLLCYYDEDTGIYESDMSKIANLIRLYNSQIRKNDIAEVVSILYDTAEVIYECQNPAYTPVCNGVFDHNSKTLLPFSPDMPFLWKINTRYIPQASAPIIHNADGSLWHPDSLVDSLSDDPEIVDLLWRILAASLRPFVHYNKMCLFIAESGNNGKGTLCELVRQLLGEENCTSIPIADMNKDFIIEDIIGKCAVITDENDVMNAKILSVGNLKAFITHDVVKINRKHQKAVSYRFNGMIIECTNSMIKVSDNSSSWLRRLIPVPFDKCFTGSENKAIKADYIKREDVKEYYLSKLLDMDVDELPMPPRVQKELQNYAYENDIVIEFAAEMLPYFQWDVVSFQFLWALFTSWAGRNYPSERLPGRTTFINDFLRALKPYDKFWYCPGKDKKIKVGSAMDVPEPLIWEYDLSEFKNPVYHGSDINRICTPMIPTYVRGIARRSSNP